MKRIHIGLFVAAMAGAAPGQEKDGWVALFNGKDFSGWKVPEGDNGHWKILEGVIDYDARTESTKDKNLWTAKEFGDFTLQVDWRIKETPYVNPNAKDILPDGTHKKGPDGKEINLAIPDSDSGILLRGNPRYQVNIWCWPVGSGEVYGVRMDKSVPPEVRAGVTPRKKADKPIGEWNAFEITVKGERLTVVLNGEKVIDNARLPGIAARGPIGLQHHGGFKDGKYTGPPSLVQFRNLRIREL